MTDSTTIPMFENWFTATEFAFSVSRSELMPAAITMLDHEDETITKEQVKILLLTIKEGMERLTKVEEEKARLYHNYCEALDMVESINNAIHHFQDEVEDNE